MRYTTFHLYVEGTFRRTFKSRDDAIDFASRNGLSDYEVLDDSDRGVA